MNGDSCCAGCAYPVDPDHDPEAFRRDGETWCSEGCYARGPGWMPEGDRDSATGWGADTVSNDVGALIRATRGLLDILRHYHKADLPENAGHADRCENPDCCAHCKAVKNATAALRRFGGAS